MLRDDSDFFNGKVTGFDNEFNYFFIAKTFNLRNKGSHFSSALFEQASSNKADVKTNVEFVDVIGKGLLDSGDFNRRFFLTKRKGDNRTDPAFIAEIFFGEANIVGIDKSAIEAVMENFFTKRSDIIGGGVGMMVGQIEVGSKVFRGRKI